MSRQNQFDFDAEDYWVTALLPEVEAVWGEVPLFKGELSELCYSAYLTSYMDSDPATIRERREVQKAFMAGAESKRGLFSQESIRKYSKAMPLDTFVPKIIGNICDVAYTESPQRIWTGDDAKDQEWGRVYKECGADRRLASAYRYARTCNIVAARPHYNNVGRLRIQILPRDMFRVLTDDGETPVQMWVPYTTTKMSGQRRTVFQVWTKTERWYTDYKGNEIPNPFPRDGEDPKERTNPYGRIPYAFLRLRESTSHDFYGPGWFELASINTFSNVATLAETRDMLYNSFSFLKAINMDIRGRNLTIGPDTVLDLNDVYGGDEGSGYLLDPSLESVQMVGQYLNAQEWRKNRVHEFLSNQDIPRHFYDELDNPPSGAALRVMERGIRRVRRADHPMLAEFELDTAELIAVVRRVDRQPGIGQPTQLDDRLPDFSISFPKEQDYIEPAAEFSLEKEKMEYGVIYPSTFYAKHSGDDKPRTDQEAVELMERNRRFLKGDFRETLP